MSVISQFNLKKVEEARNDEIWIEAMHEKLIVVLKIVQTQVQAIARNKFLVNTRLILREWSNEEIARY
jgi:hypothetical protein